MKHEEMILCDKIRVNGWKQGSFFMSCHGELCLLVTHSCDIVHGSFTGEPQAEALIAKEINEADGQFTYGKNPRKIHVELHEKSGTKWYEFATSNKMFFDRKELAELQPVLTYKIPEKTLEILIDWLAKKYNRAAFPDAFNKRISKCRGGIGKILKKEFRDIERLHIRLNSYNELPDEKPYKISLYLIIGEDAENDDMKFNDMLERIVNMLTKRPGIKISDYRVATLEEMTAKEFINTQHWDFDHLSHRDESKTPVK